MNDNQRNKNGGQITRRVFSSALAGVALTSGGGSTEAQSTRPATLPLTRPNSPLDFINTAFENGSPVQWQIAADGVVQVFLLYDYQRNSPNRAAISLWYSFQSIIMRVSPSHNA